MSVLNTVKEMLRASTQSTNRGDVTDERSEGAYWCHDCNERTLDVNAETEPPDCPECGDEMEFERSTGSAGCAC